MPVVIDDPRLSSDPRKGGSRRAPVLRRRRHALPHARYPGASGYMANLVRERLHGNTTYFNVNRHINPTDVCVASCRLCAFGKQVRDPKAYTMSLEEVWHRAGEGWSEAVTEFHIVGGLHPELTLDWYCEMLRGLKQRFPQVHLKAFTMVEIAYLARRTKISIRETLERLRDAGMDSLPGRRRRDLQRARAPHHLRPQDRRQRVARNRAHGAPAWAALQLHHALRPHRERRGPRRPPGEAARRCRTRPHGFVTFIPLAFHPDNTPLQHIPQDHRVRRYQEHRGGAADARQHPAHQGLLGDDDAADRADRAALRRRRYRRHDRGREDLPRCRRHHQRKACGAANCCS